jgi:hypothetical protein
VFDNLIFSKMWFLKGRGKGIEIMGFGKYGGPDLSHCFALVGKFKKLTYKITWLVEQQSTRLLCAHERSIKKLTILVRQSLAI